MSAEQDAPTQEQLLAQQRAEVTRLNATIADYRKQIAGMSDQCAAYAGQIAVQREGLEAAMQALAQSGKDVADARASLEVEAEARRQIEEEMAELRQRLAAVDMASRFEEAADALGAADVALTKPPEDTKPTEH